MVMPDFMLSMWATEDMGITPLDPKCINPASVDLRWSGRFIDLNDDPRTTRTTDVLTLVPGHFYLLDTMEYLRIPVGFAGMLMLKSSLARVGIEHLHAGFFDPGFEGTATLEVFTVNPTHVSLEKGQRIVQIMLIQMLKPPHNPYSKTKGRYSGQRGPTLVRKPKE